MCMFVASDKINVSDMRDWCINFIYPSYIYWTHLYEILLMKITYIKDYAHLIIKGIRIKLI